jgi:hypothetical protein
LTEREDFLLAEHVQHCEGCRAFQSALIQIQYSMQPGDDEPLAPDPAIRRNLRNRMRVAETPSHAATTLGVAWESILAVLRFRIPVYQAVLGMAALFAAFIAIDRFDADGDGEALQQTRIEQNGKQMIISSHTPPLIAQIDSQKIGRSMAEDSLWLKHIVTAM